MNTEPIVQVTADEAVVIPPEPKLVPKKRAWVVVFKYIGLMNLVAESQEELVARIRAWRRAPVAPGCASQLQPAEALSNQDDHSTIIWVDPHLIQAVLNEHVSGKGPLNNSVPEVVVMEAAGEWEGNQ